MSIQDRGAMFNVILEELFDDTFLSDGYQKLVSSGVNQSQVSSAMEGIVQGLTSLRLTSSDPEWNQFVSLSMTHPLRTLLHQDPFTRRAFEKPKGYAGDAVLLDMIYAREEHWPAPEGTSDLGRMIMEYTTSAPAPEAVRARRGHIADLLDRLADEIDRPHVLSIASGHLREAMLSSAVKRKKIGRYVALDSDMDSLEEVDRAYSRYGVEVAPATIRQLLAQKVQLGEFDLVYSAGLLDYLPENVAQRMAWTMFNMLKPRGKLLLPNFLPEIHDIGYMESYMAWKLVYRTRHDMLKVTDSIHHADIRDLRMHTEEKTNIIFLEVTKR